MKKILTTLGFVVVVMLAFNKVSTASTINFYLYITDNGGTGCSTPYSGYYYVRVHIIVNGTELCQHDWNNITGSTLTQLTWACDGDLSQYDKYTVTIDICRYSPPNSFTCCTSDSKANITMLQLTNGQWTYQLYI